MIANPFSVLLSPVHELQELQEQELHVGEEVNAVNVPKQRVQINQVQYDEFQFRPFQLQEHEFKQEIRQEEPEIMNRRIYSSSFECGMNNKNCLENYPITYKLRSHSNDYISSSYQQRKQCQDLYQEVMRYTISNHHKKKRTNSNPGEQVEMDEIDIEEEDEEEDENEEFMRFDEENGEDSFDNSTTHSSISSSSENSTSTISPTQSVSHQSNSTLSKKKNKNNDSTNDKNNDSTNDKNNNNDNSNNNTYNNNNNSKFQQHHNNNRLRFDSSGKIEYKTFSLDDRYLILPKKKKKLYKRLSLPLCHADLPSDSLALSHSSESLSASSSDASMHLLSLAPEDSFLQEGCNPQTKNDANKEAQSNNNNKQDKGEHGLINNTEIDFIQSDNLKNLKMLWKKGFISDTEFCVRKHQLTEATQSAENERGLSRHEIARRITSPIRNHLPPDFSQFKPIKALKHTFDSTTRKWSSQAITVKIDREPFGKGGLRMVYHLQDLNFINQNPNSDATFVAKTAIDQSEDPATYFRDVEMQALASSYAQLYNSYNPPRRVQFLPAWILQLPIDSMYISQASLRNTYVDTTHENRSGVLENFSYGCLDKTRRRKYMFFGVEPYIKGEYHKHNNNYGYVSDLDRNTPQAFSHFTFEASNNEILVVDIQGVMDHYTDPQIHTRSGREFGKGNLSVRGFRRFFESHRCNAICRYLKLPLVNPERTNESKGTLPAQTYMKKQQIDHVSMELRHYYDQSVAFKKHATRNLNQMEMTSYTYNPKCSMCGIDSVCTVQ